MKHFIDPSISLQKKKSLNNLLKLKEATEYSKEKQKEFAFLDELLCQIKSNLTFIVKIPFFHLKNMKVHS